MLEAVSRGEEYLVSKNQFRQCVLLIWGCIAIFLDNGLQSDCRVARGDMGRGCIIGGVIPVI